VAAATPHRQVDDPQHRDERMAFWDKQDRLTVSGVHRANNAGCTTSASGARLGRHRQPYAGAIRFGQPGRVIVVR
jgi:hypothetical protein